MTCNTAGFTSRTGLLPERQCAQSAPNGKVGILLRWLQQVNPNSARNLLNMPHQRVGRIPAFKPDYMGPWAAPDGHAARRFASQHANDATFGVPGHSTAAGRAPNGHSPTPLVADISQAWGCSASAGIGELRRLG